ncbi:radical SAM/SPASM domain-containing protein [Streptomyces gilvosporeus]|uniref:radical SAM/SPASM domain-containing protein n=1 Tax=Streptomyces gilvosporeus TaxID=553510 RepID=UPI00131CDF59|nr:radical SAM protein [Streptomyces gilvosporeus]
MGRYLGLIVKATRLCNLRCSYCHDWRSGPNQTMSFPVLARLTARALAEPAHGAVEFIWHGGEPTVLPRSFYERAVYAQARLRRPGQRIRNSLQCNGTRIDRAWARFFREFEFRVSVSLDGPPAVHDRYRRYVSGRPSFDDVRRGLDVLRDNDVPASVLMVIDRDAIELGPDPIFDFFLKEGITSYGLLAAKPTNQPDAPPGTPTPHYVTPAEMNRFLQTYFDRWLAHGDPTIRVREFDGLLNRLSDRRSTVCTLAGDCFGRYYLVEPDGEVAHCDLFVGDPAYTVGNVLSDSFTSFRDGPALIRLRGANDRALAGMRDCPDFAVCNGWCPHERYIASRHDPEFTADCCGLRELIQHMRKRLEVPAPLPQ